LSAESIRRLRVIDSHTGGEPTRVIIEGAPELGRGSPAERRAAMRAQHDDLRTACVNEPRGTEPMVGALLCEPVDPACAAGVVYFNRAGYLGMCGHGTIGLVATLAWMGRISPGEHRIETPVGVVGATLHEDGQVTIVNVPARRYRAGVALDAPGVGPVTGDVAWGGNWFFLVGGDHGRTISLECTGELYVYTEFVRRGLIEAGVTGEEGAEIDHVEIYGPPTRPDADSKNYVLCPGGAYDRSPCGTGTSAKLACLAADGKLAEGEIWRQESITGSVFEASYRRVNGAVIPSIKGSAHVNAEATLILDPRDPLWAGIR
jgi:4-hydroxyproline epimerase